MLQKIQLARIGEKKNGDKRESGKKAGGIRKRREAYRKLSFKFKLRPALSVSAGSRGNARHDYNNISRRKADERGDRKATECIGAANRGKKLESQISFFFLQTSTIVENLAMNKSNIKRLTGPKLKVQKWNRQRYTASYTTRTTTSRKNQ